MTRATVYFLLSAIYFAPHLPPGVGLALGLVMAVLGVVFVVLEAKK